MEKRRSPLKSLNHRELIAIASNLQECLVMRWEAFKIALEKMDWSYNHIADFGQWRQGSQDYLMLRIARISLPDQARSWSMLDEAEQKAYG